MKNIPKNSSRSVKHNSIFKFQNWQLFIGACISRAWAARGQVHARPPSTSSRVCNSGHPTRLRPDVPDFSNIMILSEFWTIKSCFIIYLMSKTFFIFQFDLRSSNSMRKVCNFSEKFPRNPKIHPPFFLMYSGSNFKI